MELLAIIDSAPWGFGAVLGFWLVIADWAAIEVKRHHTGRAGLLVWLTCVALPLAAAVAANEHFAASAAITGTLLGATVFWFRREERRRHELGA